MKACLEDIYHAVPRWRPRIVIRVLPIVALGFMALTWILCIIAIGCFNTGWATGGGYDVGWQEDSGGGNLGPSLYTGGQAAIAGNVVGIFFGSLGILAIIFRGLGIGYRGTTCFGGLMCFFCFMGMLMAWIVWLGESQSGRDSLGLDPWYAFYLTWIGCGFALIAGVLMCLSYFWDCIIWPRGFEEDW